MNKNNIVSVVIGLLIASIISGAGYVWLFLETFDLFGIQYLVDPEKRDGTIFYTTLLITLFNLVAMIILRSGKMKYASWGTILFVAGGTLMLLRVGPTYFKKSNYYEEFDKNKWKTSEYRIKMARHLIKSRHLIGLSKAEVVQKLGDGRETVFMDQPFIIYDVSGSYCRLALEIKDNRVEDSFLWVDD